ncbi:hypothetical protein SCALIN_C01_0156 [Candidatus Scalindua japonica]|uniref:LamG-like jellyroll fold domain-containing protein n=1 Tax=Candidatus Scalindua japonica TaxID=1284222 RepID=A0A286TTP6_9BACT|nr:LamG domain-containing protein [Candidatus Scalindua japonica]GAX59225.1 hypothetical protein SCALIN_C01_0156 [Candidatus Scalindua japonica]
MILLVLVLMSSLSLAFLAKVGTETSATMKRGDGMQASYLAETAANHAMWRLLHETTLPPVDIRITQISDDAEEDFSGNMRTGSAANTLSLGSDKYVGVRFLNVNIPPGAIISNAYVEFKSNASPSEPATYLLIRGEASDDAATFTSNFQDITNRTETSASVPWTISPQWTNNNLYQSPDLSTIVQEIVARPGWSSGNAMVIQFESTDSGGNSKACASDNYPTAETALLHVEYSAGSINPNTYYMHSLGSGRYGYKIRKNTDTTFATIATVGAFGDNVVNQSYVLYVKPQIAMPDPLCAGLIGYWELNEIDGITAADFSGNGNDGTLTNMDQYTDWVAGKIAGALDFDGSNDYINVPHNDNQSLTGGMTFAAWGNTLNTSGGYKAILAKDIPGNGLSNYWFGIENDELVFGFFAAGAFQVVKSASSNLQTDTWYHLAASFDNGTDVVRLYVDGAEVHVGAITYEPTTETADLWIGHSVDGEYWSGMLDEVRIYDRVLDPTEISQLHAMTVGGCGTQSIISTDSDAGLGGLSFTDIDLVRYDEVNDTASLFFNGSLTTLIADIDAVHVLANGHIVLSTNGPAILGGLSFDDGDLIDYNPVADTARLIFDGSMLFDDPSEQISSVHVLDNEHFVLSTVNNAILGGLSFGKGDLVEYDPLTDTASLFFDASLTTLTEVIDAVHVLDNGHIVLSTKNSAILGGLNFDDGDLVDYDPGADTATLIFDGSALFNYQWEKIISVHIGAGSGSVAPAGNLLFVVADALSLNQQEVDRKTLIESWGYQISLISDDALQSEFDTATATADVAYISQTIDETMLGTKLRNTTIGVVVEKMMSDFGIAGGWLSKSRDEIDIIDNTHYITSPFSTGLLTTTTSFQALTLRDGSPAPDVTVLSKTFNVGSTWKPSLQVIETGGELNGGDFAAGRRVQLPWGGAGFDINALNADGKTIMQRAIKWAVRELELPFPTNLLFVVDNSLSLTGNESARKTLMEGWGAVVTPISDDADTVDLTAGIAVNDVMYISQEITSLVNGPRFRDATIGIVNEEYQLSNDLGLTSGEGSGFFSSTTIQDNTHYITSGFSSGALALFDPAYDIYTGGGMTLALDLRVLGECGTISAALAALEAGDDLWDTGTAAARRVQVPWGDDFSALNADGQTIMKRAIEWAAAGSGSGGGGGGGGGGIVFEEFTEKKLSTDGTSIIMDKPPATSQSDLLIAAVATSGNNASSLSAPSGWTTINIGQTSSKVTLGVWWKQAGASESGTYTFTWSNNKKAYGWIMRLTGHDTNNPVDTFSSHGGGSNSPTSPSVTTSFDNSMILRLGGFENNKITVDDPGLPGHTAITMDESGGGSPVSGGAGYILQPTSGNSGTSNFTLNQMKKYRTVTVGISPAP